MSLDTRQPIAASRPRPDRSNTTFYEMVSSAKSASSKFTGSETASQNVFREARHKGITHLQSLCADEACPIWPNATTPSHEFHHSLLEPVSASFDIYGYHPAGTTPREFDLFSPDRALSSPTCLSFTEPVSDIADTIPAQEWTSEGELTTRRSSRRIRNGLMNVVVKLEGLGTDGGSKLNSNHLILAKTSQQNDQGTFSNGAGYSQAVPISNNDRVYVPPNSLDTAREGQEQQSQEQQPQQLPQQLPRSRGLDESRPNRFDDEYDESMEETIKPGRKNKLAQRAHDLCMNSRPPQPQSPPRHQIQHQDINSPVTTGCDSNPTPTAAMTDFPNFGDIVTADTAKKKSNVNSLTISPLVPRLASPEINQAGHFQSGFNSEWDSFPPSIHPNLVTPFSPADSHIASCSSSPHRRTESLASIASAASIADINIEKTRTDTGVTIDDIAAYIKGPDPVDNKWLCLYENCRKRFGRKENIKSHVQTHLNDRQYQCPKCKKCFVRQHDLKRHAKIHTGIKPYPCECGNSFARQDALTRHRQRGMCIGKFDGIIRRTVKRGRPRKKRPDTTDRMDKSAWTRERNESTPSISSHSGHSDNSVPNSPHHFRDLEILDDIPFMTAADVTDSQLSMSSASSSTATINPAVKLAVQSTTIATLANQQVLTSPSAMSNTSFHSVVPERLAEAQMVDPTALASHPESPMNSSVSQYNTPPDLSASSSPPCTTSSHLFKVDDSCTTSEEDVSQAAVATSTAFEECMLLDTWADGGNRLSLDNLNRDSGILMFSKFDEEYENAVNMFTEGGDLLLESP